MQLAKNLKSSRITNVKQKATHINDNTDEARRHMLHIHFCRKTLFINTVDLV